ncbi:tRNA pseudouridine(55) synthase TruB [soil metagenome]
MARRRKGRDVHGWLVLDKPAGPSSSAAVAKVRAAFGASKAGHAGTLDPGATGLLAIALGEATKTVPYVTDAAKAYRFTIRWGAATDTDDAEGAVIETSAARPDAAAIRAALPRFTGMIEQVPPRYSAVKVGGARAYALARAGEAPALAPRPLHVERLVLEATPDAGTAVLEMVCGKGGYVRAIARDLGRVLGTCGHVAALRRLWSGPFALSDGIDWERLEALAGKPALEAHLLPVAAGLRELPQIAVPPAAAARLRNGNPAEVAASGGLEWGDEAWASAGGQPVAIGIYRGGLLHPVRVFRLDAGAAAPI